MQGRALAVCACAGLGMFLAAACERSGEKYPIPDQGAYDQQGSPEVPGLPPSPDVRERTPPPSEQNAPQGRREVTMTVGNGEGNFFADKETLARIEGEGQVVFRYLDNPNGSVADIAGIVNKAGNIIGLMPHPDRAFEEDLGSADGAILFRSALASA